MPNKELVKDYVYQVEAKERNVCYYKLNKESTIATT